MKALREEEGYEIPMTPLIDMVFLLLVFFMMATNFTRDEIDHAVTLPESESGVKASRAPDRMTINIRSDGTLVVNGSVKTEDELRAMVGEFAAAYPERPAVIRADARVTYQAVMRIFGICRSGGVRSINLPILEPGEN